MADFAMRLLPSNILEWIAIAVGIFVGLIFALNWKIPKTLSSAVIDPRLKSLKYFLGGFIVALIADWQKIVGADFQISKLRITGFYAVPFLLSTAATLVIVSCLILLQSRDARKKGPDTYPAPPFNPVLEYLHYGYAHYQEEYQNRVAKKQEAANNRSKHARDRAMEALARCIAAIEQCTDARTAAMSVHQLLNYVCLTAESYIGSGSVNSNYMLAVPYASATSKQRELERYAFGSAPHYEFLLVLQSYAKPEGDESFALPVGPKSPGWEHSALPGAPTAFLERYPIVVDAEKLPFGKDVPKNIQKEIREYFAGKKFKVFVCIIIPGPSHPRGIMNLEFESRDPFQGSTEAATELVKLVEPFCGLLSLILSKGFL